MKGRFVALLAMLALTVLGALPALAAGGPDLGEGQLAQVAYGANAVEWGVFAEHEAATLTISTPCGVIQRVYPAGKNPLFQLEELSPDDPNGAYTWQIRIQPVVDPKIQDMLMEARGTGKEQETFRALWREGLLPKGPFLQTGSFSVVEGRIVEPTLGEEKRSSAAGPEDGSGLRVTGATSEALEDSIRHAVGEQVISGDLTVYNSLCVGFDCLASESYGSDTIRLKENNLRIHVEDTSTAASFPSTDWRLEFNSNANGGGGYFRVIDASGNRNIMTLEAGAPSNSLVIDNGGRAGFGTANPVVELHSANGDTPTLRLEQTTSSGFAAQTWDVAGNETSFFVRDATNGSTLPFRIRPGASSNSLVVSNDSNVGVGILSPPSRLTVKSPAEATDVLVVQDNDSSNSIFRVRSNAGGSGLFSVFDDAATEVIRFTGQGGGRVAIGCNNGLVADLELNSSGGNCNSGTYSQANAGDTQFTVSSSRTIKEHLNPVRRPDILETIAGIDVYEYDFINGPQGRIGLMAEDFHQVFQRGPDNMLNGHEIQMALWLAVRELIQQNQDLKLEVETLKENQQPVVE